MKVLVFSTLMVFAMNSDATDEFYFPSKGSNPSVGVTPQVPVVCEDGKMHRRVHAVDQINLFELKKDILMVFRSTIIDCWREKGKNQFQIIKQLEDSCRVSNRVKPESGFNNDGVKVSGVIKNFAAEYSAYNYCETAILFPKKATLENYHLKTYRYTYHYFGLPSDYQWLLTVRHNAGPDDFDIVLPNGQIRATQLSSEYTGAIEEWLSKRYWK